MSMARRTFPSRLELNKPEGSCSAAPLANVILTTFLYVSPVQTMPPRDQTGVPGLVGLTHFHSSTISGSASWIISRTFASIFPRQSPSSWIFLSMDAEADFTGTVVCMYGSNARTYFSCSPSLQPPQVEGECPTLNFACFVKFRVDVGDPTLAKIGLGTLAKQIKN